MNIAILIPELSSGGAERAASLLGNYYYSKGHEVYYFLLVNSFNKFYKVDGTIVETHIFSPFAKDKKINILREMCFAAKKLRALKRKYEIDVAISFMEEWNFINAFARGRGKTVLSVRTVWSKRKEFSGVLYDSKWIKRILTRANSIVAVSEYVKKDLCDNYLVKKDKIITIPNISVKRKPFTTEEWKFGNRVVVTVGRLEHVKQHARLIRAFVNVVKNNSESQLIIVGGGRLRDYLYNLCKELNIQNNVHITGAVKDVSYYLMHSKVFVMTSKLEGFPNAMVEAMAEGLPVITTDSPGGCGEIVGKETAIEDIQLCKYGILTPDFKDVEKGQTGVQKEEIKLADAINLVLDNDDIHNKYSRASLIRAKMYSYDEVMPLWDSILGV